MKKSTVFSFLLGALASSIIINNKDKIEKGIDAFKRKINKPKIDEKNIDLLDHNVAHPYSKDIMFLNNVDDLSKEKYDKKSIYSFDTEPEDYLDIDKLLWKGSTLKRLFDRDPFVFGSTDGCIRYYIVLEPIYYDNPFNVSKAILLYDTLTNERFFIGVEFNNNDDRNSAIDNFFWKYFGKFCYSGDFKLYSLDSSIIEKDLGLNITLDYKADECIFFWLSRADFKFVQREVAYKKYLFFGLPTHPGYEYEARINFSRITSDFRPRSKVLEIDKNSLPIAFHFNTTEDAEKFISFIKDPFKDASQEFSRTYKEIREYVWDNFNILLHDDFLDCVYTAYFIKYENLVQYNERLKHVVTIGWKEHETFKELIKTVKEN